MNTDFPIQGRNVIAYRAWGEVKPGADLWVCHSGAEQPEHLTLPTAELPLAGHCSSALSRLPKVGELFDDRPAKP